MPPNSLDLTGRHFLITGAASGIGFSAAKLLNSLGARLTLVDLNHEGLELCAEGLRRESGVFLHSVDLIETINIENAISLCAAESGLFNGFVHCAGIQQVNPIRTLSIPDWRRLFTVNCEAGFALAKTLSSKKYYVGDHGSFIFISSVMGLAGSAGAVAYSTSKAALHGMCRSLALELASKRIRVNCIAPGFVKTKLFEEVEKNWDEQQKNALEDLHPLGFGTPEDIANAIAFLAADTGRWITGSVLVVDGGYLAR